MNRREFITASGGLAVASFAGCIEQENDNTIEIGQTVPTQDGSVRVTDFLAKQSVEVMGAVHRQVRNDPQTQYLLFNFYVGNSKGEPSQLVEELKNRLKLNNNGTEVPAIRQESALTINSEDEEVIIFPVEKPLHNLDSVNLIYAGPENKHQWRVGQISRTTAYESYLQNPPEVDVTSVRVLSDEATEDSVPINVTVEEVSGNQFSQEEFNVKIGSTALSSSPVYSFTVREGTPQRRRVEVDLFKSSGTETIRVSWVKDSVTRDFNHDEN